MNRLRFIQIKSIKIMNRLLVGLLTALILLATQGNIGFLWMQTYYYATSAKEQYIRKKADTGSDFLYVGRLGNELGDYSFYVSGMVDPDFVCSIGGDKAKDATIIWNTLIQAGINPAAIAGIINNYFGEGHTWQYNGAYAGNKNAVEWCHQQIDAFNNGNMTPKEFQKTKYINGKSTAFGAWQWLGDRKLCLAKSARNANADIGSIEFQILYVLCEMGLSDELSDYVVRGSKSKWECFKNPETMTPKEYAIYFACYFEGYIQGATGLSAYADNSIKANREHTGKAQQIYDEFMAAAKDYSALHSNMSGVNSALYDGNILPSNFATKYNIETSKMTAQRWKLVERAYYWCDYGSGDYIRYSMNLRMSDWKKVDSIVAEKKLGYLDCSSFIRLTYASIGITNVQSSTGVGNYANNHFRQIKSDELVAGDIIAHASYSGHPGHVQMFLGWVNPADHSKGYYKAAAHGQNGIAGPNQVSIKTDSSAITNSSGWDKNDRAYRHEDLPIGNGTTASGSQSSRIDVAGSSKNVLIIGDSRTEGMCNAANITLANFGSFTAGNFHLKKGQSGNMTILCCSSAGKRLLQDSSVLTELGKACNNKDSIVIALGVNDLDFQSYYNIISDLGSKTKVYWCTSGPVTGNNTKNQSIKNFNDKIITNTRAGNYTVLDYYSWVTALDYKTGISSDGIHYSSSINKSLFDTLSNKCQN